MTFDNYILKLVYEFHGYGIILYVLITSTIAAVLSLLLCLERLLRGKSISIKTHMLLSIGCSLLMTISIWAIRIADGSIDINSGPGSINTELSYDTSRIAAAVVTGMGFLGAGAIIKDKFTVKGLSTAATLWISAAVGLACGSGFILESIIFTVLVILFLLLATLINKVVRNKSPYLIVELENNLPLVKIINESANENNVIVRSVIILSISEKTKAKIIFPYNYNKETISYFKNQLEQLKFKVEQFGSS